MKSYQVFFYQIRECLLIDFVQPIWTQMVTEKYGGSPSCGMLAKQAFPNSLWVHHQTELARMFHVKNMENTCGKLLEMQGKWMGNGWEMGVS